MRHKGLKLTLFIIVGLGLSGLQAQTMYVKENVGTQTVYSLSNIGKISFSSGNLTISLLDTSSVVYTISSLRHLSFSDSIPVNNGPENIINHVIRIFR